MLVTRLIILILTVSWSYNLSTYGLEGFKIYIRDCNNIEQSITIPKKITESSVDFAVTPGVTYITTMTAYGIGSESERSAPYYFTFFESLAELKVTVGSNGITIGTTIGTTGGSP